MAEGGCYEQDIEDQRQNRLMGVISVTTNNMPTLLHEVGSMELPFVILLCTHIVLL